MKGKNKVVVFTMFFLFVSLQSFAADISIHGAICKAKNGKLQNRLLYWGGAVYNKSNYATTVVCPISGSGLNDYNTLVAYISNRTDETLNRNDLVTCQVRFSNGLDRNTNGLIDYWYTETKRSTHGLGTKTLIWGAGACENFSSANFISLQCRLPGKSSSNGDMAGVGGIVLQDSYCLQ